MKHPYKQKGTPLISMCAQPKHLAHSMLPSDYSRLCSLRRATNYSRNYACILAASLARAVRENLVQGTCVHM